jgi:hypothetical protein
MIPLIDHGCQPSEKKSKIVKKFNLEGRASPPTPLGEHGLLPHEGVATLQSNEQKEVDSN